MTETQTSGKRRKRGFERASGLLRTRIREVSEDRGFSESRLLTHWEDIVGEATAKMSKPVKVSYAKKEFGATLTLLTTGAFAPMLQAELPKIRERVNAVYGYNAISHIHVTQTAPTGFLKGNVAFSKPAKDSKFEVSSEIRDVARSLADGAEDENLRKALEKFAGTFLTRHRLQTKEDK